MANKKSQLEQSGPEDTYMGKGYHWYVDSATGADSGNSGGTWRTPFLTLGHALAMVAAYDVIHLAGTFSENVTVPYNLNDLTIIGADYNVRSSHLKAAADTAAIITVKAPRVTLMNLYMEAPATHAAIRLNRGPITTTDYANDCVIDNIEFWTGYCGVYFGSAGPHNVTIRNCKFRNMRASGATAIMGDAGALPQRTQIRKCMFRGNINHVVLGIDDGEIIENEFMDQSFGSQGTTTKLSLSGGSNNIVTRNIFAGTYTSGGGYVASGGTDGWDGNFVAGGLTTANPV